MFVNRIIPLLLYSHGGLVKTIKFNNPTYIGDPINAVKIFNEKEVDELLFIDIDATKEKRKPDFEYIKNITEECFMPLCYGGGITTIDDIKRITGIGVEKIAINSQAFINPKLVEDAAKLFGSSTIVVSIDVKQSILGQYSVSLFNGTKNTKINPVDFAKEMQNYGAGEILLNSVNKEGKMNGFDLGLIKLVTDAVNIPVIACGGAGCLQDIKLALENGASAVAAGSMFVYNGKYHAVLINYPTQSEIQETIN